MKVSMLNTLASTLLLTCSLAACANDANDDDELQEGESALVSRTSTATTSVAKTSESSVVLATNIDRSQLATLAFTLPKPDPTVSGLDTAFPWVVDISGTGSLNCRGVLIHPSWVLTAGHCIGKIAGKVSYTRTDPTTGAQRSDSRNFDVNATKRGMYTAPGFVLDSGFGQPQNDLALIKLDKPFVLGRDIQTAALPSSAAIAGRTGTLPTHVHDTSLPQGYTSLFRTQQLAQASCPAPTGFVCINPPAASMCEGDSGSGFIEVLDNRATVVGITSNISGGSSCVTAGGQAQLSDVFAYRDWILSTMGMTAQQIAGRVRLRWSGASSSGTMSLMCIATNGPEVAVPMDVVGGELSMDCDDARVFCQPATGFNLISFNQRSFAANGSFLGTTQQPFLSSWTAAYGDPGSSFLEFTCGVASSTSAVNTTTSTLAMY